MNQKREKKRREKKKRVTVGGKGKGEKKKEDNIRVSAVWYRSLFFISNSLLCQQQYC